MEFHKEEEDQFKGVDKKLGDLMLRGWTMLAESCPLESCNCPLMRSPDGQKYCVNCEMWQFDNNKTKKKKFTELVPLHGKQDLQLKHTEIIKPKKFEPIPIKTEKNVEELLHDKLQLLAKRIYDEKDMKKIDEVSKVMEQIMSLIEHYKKIYSS